MRELIFAEIKAALEDKLANYVQPNAASAAPKGRAIIANCGAVSVFCGGFSKRKTKMARSPYEILADQLAELEARDPPSLSSDELADLEALRGLLTPPLAAYLAASLWPSWPI